MACRITSIYKSLLYARISKYLAVHYTCADVNDQTLRATTSAMCEIPCPTEGLSEYYSSFLSHRVSFFVGGDLCVNSTIRGHLPPPPM